MVLRNLCPAVTRPGAMTGKMATRGRAIRAEPPVAAARPMSTALAAPPRPRDTPT